jgi:predicted aspartyl protease
MRRVRMAAVAALALVAALPAARAGCKFKRSGSIPLEWKQGLPHIDGSINGTPVEMVVDTGTSGIVIPSGLADELHLPQRHANVEWVGTGGRVQGYDAKVADIRFGTTSWHNVTLPVENRPKARVVHVGATFLLQADLEMTAQSVIFFTAKDCEDAPLAYWSSGVPYTGTEPTAPGDNRIFITVQINGQPVHALVDSGRAVSMLDLDAARRFGFDEKAHAAAASTGGAPSWSATFDTFAIDEEIVRHAHLRVGDVWGRLRKDMNTIEGSRYVNDQPELILGADFLKAHRVLFARSQRRMYLSYVGGPMFDAPTEAAAPAGASSAP